MGKVIKQTDDGLPVFGNDDSDVLVVSNDENGLPVFSKKKAASNGGGNGLNQPSPSQSQSPLQSGSVKTFDEPALKLSDGGVPANGTPAQTAPSQNIDFDKLNAQHGIVAPTSEEKIASAASEEKVQEKVANKAEAIKNTLSRKYGDTPNINSPEYRKEFNTLQKQLNDGDVVLTHAKDGKPFVVRSQGFLESAGKTLVESFKAPLEGLKLQNMDGKELADYLDKKSAEQPYLEESAPSPLLGELGSATGGFPKIAGEFSLNEAVPYLGTALATADAEASSTGFKTAELYQKNLKELTDNGVPLEEARIEAADKAKKDAPLAAAPDALLTAALGEYGADTKGISDAAQTFKQTLIKSGESIGKFGVLGGTAGVSEAGIEKAQGYDISMKDALDKFGEEGFQYATMDAMFKILPVASKLPSAAYRAWKEYMTKIPAPQFLDEINNQVKNGTLSQDEADKAAANLGGYVKAKNKTIPTGNVEKDGLITELVQKKLKLEEDKKTLDPNFHKEKDKQIADIDSKINLVKYSKRPIETDDITGEFNLNPKTHDELTAKEKEGIVVPKEYGGTEVEEVGGKGEDAEKKYKPTAYFTENKGKLELKQPIEVGDKTYSDKQKAQEAADKALKQHYYENGLHDSGKPQKKQQDNGLQLQKEEETSKVTEPATAGAGGETAPDKTEATVNEKPLSRDEVKSLHDNLTPEQKQEYLDQELEGKGDEYLKSLNNGKTLPNAAAEEKPKEEPQAEVVQPEAVEGNKSGNEKATEQPTTEEIKQLGEVHKNLAAQYLKKHTELVKQGLRGDELNNHPELVAIKSQMDKIEQAFQNDFKSPEQPTKLKEIEDKYTSDIHEANKADLKLDLVPDEDLSKHEDARKLRKKQQDIVKRLSKLQELVKCK